jgi:uncharacterized membrane protein
MRLARRPTADSRRRLVGIDVARCLALLGMMATHMLPGYVGDEIPWPQQLAGGRASALFAVLAGVSIALMTGRQEPPRGRERAALSTGLAMRALVIATLGLALGDLRSGVAVILTYYGLLFVLGLPFLGLRSRALFVLAAGWLVVAPVLGHLLRPALPERGFGSPTFASLADPVRLLSELTFTGYYPTVPWLAYLLVGMAIGRLDLTGARVATTLLFAGAAVAAAAWWVSGLLTGRPDARSALLATYNPDFPPSPQRLDAILTHGLFGVTPTESWWWLTVVSPHTATPFDLAQTIGSATAVIGLCLLASRLWPRGFAVAFGAGAMTLTLDSLHVVMLTPDVWPGDEGLPAYRTQVIIVLGIGALFALLRLRGPLEAATATISRAFADTVRLAGPVAPTSR